MSLSVSGIGQYWKGFKTGASAAKDWFDELTDDLISDDTAETVGEVASTSPTAACGIVSSGGSSSGEHFYLEGEAQEDWSLAADQVLRFHCTGIPNPSAQQIQTMRDALIEANRQHLENEVGSFHYHLETPEGVDHRTGEFLSSDTEIFVPWSAQICPTAGTQVPPPIPTPLPPTPPIPQPDAGVAPDVRVPDVADAGAPEVAPAPQPEAGAEEVTPEVGPEVVPEVVAPVEGPSPLQLAKSKLRTEITRASALIAKYRETNISRLATLAATLQTAVDTAQRVYDNSSLLSELTSAFQALKQARQNAVAQCEQASEASTSTGGTAIQCQ